ncbi:MAG: hypothetical protein EBX92_06160, partial [Actinobacteria bacterium]|nr:hypothetical protein [Actinomycetota bacterium]
TSTTNGSQIVGLIYAEPRNAADTRTATSGSAVDATVNLVVSGAGLLANASAPTTVGKSINVARGETVNVIADGTAGTMTITGYIGGVALTQAAKTITFVGYADTFIPTVESSTIITGSTGTGAITFVVKDSAGSALGSSLVQTRPNGYPSATSGYWLVVADTKVVGGTAVNAVSSTAAYTQCAYNATRAKYVCNVPVVDSGTATVYIADSLTVGTALKTSQALTITVAGPAYKGTVKFDKTSYNVGEAATLTLTSKDYGDRDAINGTTSPFSGLYWVGQALSTTAFTKNGSSNASGGTFTDIAGYIDGSGTDKATYVNGVDTALVYMPTTAGTFTLFGKTAGAATASQILTFTVTDPVQDAQTAAIAAAQKAAVAQAAAAQAAADAATDAALQAIDAANAATDAANLAAEAADAATVAAQEAKDAADAATAAVESLATQVATLMAALQAQITSLANVVAKIAKKVKA